MNLVLLYFREVFKARDRKTGRLVALKKVCMDNEKEGVSLNNMLYDLYQQFRQYLNNPKI